METKNKNILYTETQVIYTCLSNESFDNHLSNESFQNASYVCNIRKHDLN